MSSPSSTTMQPLAQHRAHPDSITLLALKETLRRDQKALAGNPIVREAVARYFDIAFNVDDIGVPCAPVEDTVEFRERVNELTVGHFNQVKRRKEKLAARNMAKQQEKTAKKMGQEKFQRTQRTGTYGH